MFRIKIIIHLIVNICSYGLANIIPKSENVWVFGAWFGKRYSDNPKAMFEYVNEKHPDILTIWIAKDITVIKDVRDRGYKAYYYKSFKGMYYQLRAKFVLVCTSKHDDLYSPCISNKTKVIQLWHGIPLKKIMFDVFGNSKKNKNQIGKIFDGISVWDSHKNDLVIATSELTQDILSKAFRVPKGNTVISGFPRNDVFLNKLIPESNKGSFKCIYMPTHRGGVGADCEMFQNYGFDFKSIEKTLIEYNIVLILRMHPFNKPSKVLIELIENSKVISLDNTADIYESISDYDCLITDYSSIYFDYLLSDKPIVFAPFDLVNYMDKERSLYFEFPEVTLKPFCFNWPDIISRLIDIKENGLTDIYKSEYKELKLKFHAQPESDFTSFSKQLMNSLLHSK